MLISCAGRYRARRPGILSMGGRHRRPGSPIPASLAASVGATLMIASLVAWQRGPTLATTPRSAPADRMAHGAPRPPVMLSRTRTPPGVERPVRIIIPAIGVSAPVVDLALNPDGSLEVPSGFLEAGWYVGSSVPGAAGPAVIVGHVDSRSGPAVFYLLRELTPGAEVDVRVRGKGLRRFIVTRVAEYPKSAFPTEAVYGSTSRQTLRLITCGGSFDFSTGHYVDNVVVYAVAAPLLATGASRIDRWRGSAPA